MLLHAVEAGAGAQNFVLLHGLFGRSANFGSFAKRLAADWRVVSLDLRNHGASPHAAGMDYATMAADVAETLAAMEALPCVLLGHSMGGKVAAVFALTQPDAVTKLVVADIAPVAYAHHNTQVARAMLSLDLSAPLTRAQADAALAASVPNAGIRGFLLQNFVPGAKPGWKIGLAEIAAGMPEIEGFPKMPDSARYDGPVLFLTGERSDYVLPSHHALIQALFPHVVFEALLGAGHWLHADAPEAFAEAVLRFAA